MIFYFSSILNFFLKYYRFFLIAKIREKLRFEVRILNYFTLINFYFIFYEMRNSIYQLRYIIHIKNNRLNLTQSYYDNNWVIITFF